MSSEAWAALVGVLIGWVLQELTATLRHGGERAQAVRLCAMELRLQLRPMQNLVAAISINSVRESDLFFLHRVMFERFLEPLSRAPRRIAYRFIHLYTLVQLVERQSKEIDELPYAAIRQFCDTCEAETAFGLEWANSWWPYLPERAWLNALKERGLYGR